MKKIASIRVHALMAPWIVAPALLAASCGTADPGTPTELEPVAVAAPVTDGEEHVSVRSFDRNGDAVDEGLAHFVEVTPPTPAAPVVVQPVRPEARLGDELRARLSRSAARFAQDMVEVTIVVRDDLPTPALPPLNPLVGRDVTSNVRLMNTRLTMLDSLRAHRFSVYAPLIEQIERAGGALRERYIACKCFRAEVPASLISALAARDDVAHIELSESESPTPPPVDSNSSNDIADAKARIVYSNLSGFSSSNGQWLALLDTGVRATHTSLTSGVNWVGWLDCVNGGTNCDATSNAGFNADDSDWNHGTSSASILVGNGNLGADHRGLLTSQFGSMKVYTSAGLNRAAAVRAFDLAQRAGYDVVVAEMQDSEFSPSSSIATAANSAFDAGLTVVAADGNTLQGVCDADTSGNADAGKVAGPAHSKKVIGVGTYDINSSTNDPLTNFCYGSTQEGVIKPDILMPTRTEAASNASSTATRVFGGTSGATPYGGAAAMLIRNYYFANGWSVEPGNVYAALIGNGSGSVSDRSGAGAVNLRSRSCTRWYNGWRSVSNGQTVEIPFDVGTGTQELRMAIWWPEGNGYHNNIDVTLVNPTGLLRVHGSGGSSRTWKRVSHTTSESGRWTAKISGLSVSNGPQKVYLLLHTILPSC